MLVHADVVGLELVVAGELSGDLTLCHEIRTDAKSIHTDNQTRLKLPTRRDAKIFVFKLIYGGTAYGFSTQHDFAHVSTSPKFWENLFEEFYRKYSGIARWHENIVREVCSTGKLVLKTGREFHYPVGEVVDKLWYWRPKILNYPVQGTGADLVSIGRVTAWKRLRQLGVPHLWQSTVHDSVDLDVPNIDIDGEPCYNIVCRVIHESFRDIPKNFEALFGVPFNLPIDVEIVYGPNLGETTPWQPKSPS